ncbi:MAG: Mn(2+) uptake NRAMP transporter MntH [Terrimonas sp.]|nr:Mn(2+) uptake NRAMP transporter MntH [Terrimonas sp.]
MSSKSFDHSLSEVHGSVDTTASHKPAWRRLLSFFGPAYLISVGYMDPGNWATDLQGGSQFGYKLIWVLLMSNLMALILQSLSARLGIVRGRDLAQANREVYPRGINLVLYVLAEIAIAATDLAEVLGMAIGIQLLTGIPLLYAVGITVFDTLLLLLLQRLGMRKMEAFIMGLVAVIGLSFLVQILLAKPDLGEVVTGFVPHIPNNAALYIAIGIIGATVMPHNLYLHSAIVQTRKIKRDDEGIRKAIKYNTIDSAIALNLAFFVNAAILVLAATVFFKTGRTDVAEIKTAHELLEPLLGSKLAPTLFAIALIAAGQSSTITGTLAGQIVMEGYLHLRINPWIRRLITRLIAIIPAVIVIAVSGEKEVDNLLVLSQVILSLQLGFAIIPLIHFVSDKATMGKFAIGTGMKTAAWLITSVLVYLNIRLVAEELSSFFASGGNIMTKIIILICIVFFAAVLIFTFLYPLKGRKKKSALITLHPEAIFTKLEIPDYKKIAIALDFGSHDLKLLSHAAGQGHKDTLFILIHIVESASARVLGKETDDMESRKDREQLDFYIDQLRSRGYQAIGLLGYRNRSAEIVRLVKENNAEMLVIGAHRHSGLKDIIYGETIEKVRHELDIPVLVVNI